MPSKDTKDQSNDKASGSPDPEVLKPRDHDGTSEAEGSDSKPEFKSKHKKVKGRKTPLRARYHLSHKATFIGLMVVIVVLAINAIIITFVIRAQQEADSSDSNNQVTISQDVLSRLGVNRATVDDLGAELLVGPNASFDKDVQVGGNVSIGGELTLNDRLSATDANFANLQAGNTSLEQLNVNGDGTLSNLNVRNDLVVAGTSRFQGPTTVSQLFTAEGSANVSGNLTVGGSLSVNSLHVSGLVVDSTVTLGGHIITRGSAPSVGPGPAIGSNGTVSISGNDTSGTVAVNTGTGAGNGTVVNVSFRQQYGSTPHVVVTPIGNVGSFYVFRTGSGFSIGVGNSLSPGGYAFDYIVMQ